MLIECLKISRKRMFLKYFLCVLFSVSLLHAYVIDRHMLVPDNFIKLETTKLNFQQSLEVTAGLFEGDIAINNEDYRELRLGVNFAQFPNRKWPNFTVPFMISPLYSDDDIATINKAIITLNSLSCLKFKPYNNEEDAILIWPVENPQGCYSFIGRQGGVQIVSLKGTDTLGTSCLHDEGK